MSDERRSGDISALYGGDGIPAKEQEDNFGVLPAGWYRVGIDNAEIRENSKKTGEYLKLTLTVLDGQFENRKIFPNITLRNPNKTAVEIGMEKLGGLAHALGDEPLGHVDQAIGKMVDVRLKISKGKDGYADDNDAAAFARPGTRSQGKGKGKTSSSSGGPASKTTPVEKKAKRPWET